MRLQVMTGKMGVHRLEGPRGRLNTGEEPVPIGKEGRRGAAPQKGMQEVVQPLGSARCCRLKERRTQGDVEDTGDLWGHRRSRTQEPGHDSGGWAYRRAFGDRQEAGARRRLPPWVGGVSGWGLSRLRPDEPHRREDEGPSGSKQVGD